MDRSLQRLIRLSCMFLAAAVTAGAAVSEHADAADPLVLETRIPLGNVAGRIDHLAIDLKRQRLFVAELGNDTVGVVDLRARTVMHRLTGLKEPQGVGYVEAADELYVANGGDGSVRRYRATGFSSVGGLELGRDADDVRVNAARSLVVVGYGEGALAFLDAASGRKAAEVGLPGHPEAFEVTADATRAFVNVPDSRQVAVVDVTRRQRVDRWRSDAGGNFPMALDEADGRLFIVARSPPALKVFDTARGTVLASLRTCGDADDVFFDRRRRRLYVSCGAGSVAVVQENGGAYSELGRVRTVIGARTSLFVPGLDRLFVAVRAREREPAAIWVFRPNS